MTSPHERLIIVVDDLVEAVNSGAVAQKLTQEGRIPHHQLLYVSKLKDLEEKIQQGKLYSIDLLIVDLDQPDTTEIDSLNTLTQLQLGNTPVIAVTPSLLDIKRQDLQDRGIRKLLVKPFDPNELEEAIIEVLSNQSK